MYPAGQSIFSEVDQAVVVSNLQLGRQETSYSNDGSGSPLTPSIDETCELLSLIRNKHGIQRLFSARKKCTEVEVARESSAC